MGLMFDGIPILKMEGLQMLQWRPADDPPEVKQYTYGMAKSVRVLVFIPNIDLGRKIQFGAYFRDGVEGEGWWQIEGCAGFKPTHWAPLVEPEFRETPGSD